MRNSEHNVISLNQVPDEASSEHFYAALYDIGQLLIRALEPPALYEAVIDVLQRRIGAKLVMVGEADHESGWFHRVAPALVPAGQADIYPERLPFSVTHDSFWQGQTQIEPDISHKPGLEMFRDAYEVHGVACAAAVPIMKFGKVCAGLSIRSSSAEFFSARVLELLQQAAATIGLGLEAHEQRHLLMQSVQEGARQRSALRLLSEMIKVVTHSADEQVLLADACRVAHGMGGYRFAWIGLLNGVDGKTLELRAYQGLSAEFDVQVALDITDPGSVNSAAVIAMTQERPEIRQLSQSCALVWPVAQELNDVRALLALPLLVEGVVVGAMVIGATEALAFTADEVQVFQEMAVELGLGIQMQRAHAARLQAESELRANLQYFRTILSNQHAGVLVIAEDDTVKFANEAFCSLFGFAQTPVELEGCPISVIHERLSHVYDDPGSEAARLCEVLAGDKPVRNDEVAVRGGRTFLCDFTPIRIAGVPQGRIWQQRDITEQKLHEAKVERLAFYDVVTGLPNRRLLFELLEQTRAKAAQEQSLLAVGVLDLDRFKSVNDTIGHGGGDHVLAEASARVLGMLREADVLARIGGDEFALLIPGLDSTEQLDVISRCILQALRAPFNLMGEQFYLSASIGWTLFPRDDADAGGLVRHADLAMYAAKEEGKDRGLFYEPAMEHELARMQVMRERVALALQQSQLRLAFQPIVYIDGLPGLNGVAGMEALLRLDDTGEEWEGPANFMHVLDDPQLARPIGRYVLDEALKHCQSWLQAGISLPVSVNISTRHLLHPAFFSDIDAALEAYPGVMDVGFGIEVTETGPTMDSARAKIVIEECRRRGIRVGLDDFGTGTASLSHIQQLDIEHIKLDQSFVRDILVEERNMAIAAGVITTARMLAKAVIAEGVETAEQGDLLASLGCHQLQGFWISRPMPADEVPAWVVGWVPPTSWRHLVDERQSLLASPPGGN